MATFDHERAHMAANLVSDPPVSNAPRYKYKEKLIVYLFAVPKLQTKSNIIFKNSQQDIIIISKQLQMKKLKQSRGAQIINKN